MTPRTMKARLRAVERVVKKWRTVLLIDSKWDVAVGAAIDKEDPNTIASIDLDYGSYWNAEITVYPKLIDNTEYFKENLDAAVIHELLHLVMWPLTSFAVNLAGNDSEREVNKLDDQIVKQLEKVFCGRKKKKKVVG